MDQSLQYTQVMSNFDSAYNASPSLKPPSTTYIPMSSSTTFSTFSNRSSSPLFRRSISPPWRPPISTGPVPKFNFDLYKMDENNNQYEGYSSPTYRSISPPSSRTIHHYPIHSPLSSSTSKPQTLSKLREINDELCRTLARSELTDQSSSPHYHIHHYPLSQRSHPKHRSRSTSKERSSSTEIEVSPKIHKARVTYKIHMPRRHRQEQQQHRKSSHDMPTSDVYSSDEPITVDLYPTRDQGFVKQMRKHSDNQNPWLVDGTSLRRNSYSDTRTSRAPQSAKGPYYGDKPIKSYRRSIRGKERPSSSSRHRSPYVTSRIRPDSAPLYASDQFHESNDSFSNTTPAWRSNGSIKRPKFMGAYVSSRGESPSFKTRERIWHPTSKRISERPPKYFQPILKPEYDVSIRKRVIDATESDPVTQRKTLSNRTQIRSDDPKFKQRIANAESKVKSTWEPTATRLTQSPVNESKPPIPLLVKKTTTSTPPKSKIKSVPSEPTAPTKKVVTGPPTTTNTGRSSLNDIPTKSIYESTPRNQSNAHENDNSVQDLSENESQTSEPSKKQQLPRPPPPIEKTPTPQQPSTELPKTTVPEPDKGTKATIKDGALIRGNDIRNHNPTPSPTSEVNNNNNHDDDETSDVHNAQPSKPNNKNDESVIDDDEDENDQEVARSFDINKWLNDASKAISGSSKKGDLIIPSTAPQPPTKSNAKSPPRRREQPPSPSPDENLYKPPFGPKKKDQKPSSSPPPATTKGETDEVDDFFN